MKNEESSKSAKPNYIMKQESNKSARPEHIKNKIEFEQYHDNITTNSNIIKNNTRLNSIKNINTVLIIAILVIATILVAVVIISTISKAYVEESIVEIVDENSIAMSEKTIIVKDPIVENKNLVAKKCTNAKNPYMGEITEYMDLNNRQDVTKEQVKNAIEYFCKEYPNSPFIGTEEYFVEASNESGLDVFFLLSLAGYESGWDVSNLHRKKNNPYSINMVDTDPTKGYNMGSSFGEGIVNGAKWIKDNYYNEGQHNLHEFIYGNKCYSSYQDEWIDNVVYIMNQAYEVAKV